MRPSVRAAAILASAALAACASTKAPEADPEAALKAAREQIGGRDLLTQMSFWAQAHAADPADLEAARAFIDVLRRGGRLDRAVEVGGEALRRHPGDVELVRSVGMALLGLNRGAQAAPLFAALSRADASDWQARAALGVALDQAGLHTEARRAYAEALTLAPGDAGVLTNLGASHLLSGDPETAEEILREAAGQAGATPQTRQNLALAIALQGRFDEAARLARVDLPPELAENNLAYLRALIGDQRRWSDLKRGS